ncbi:class II histocompatibility antigen, B-L beta chain-like isoform X1 [Strix aluco]|uniref:class II histocompatibility antigen, B-L beta chain-like isoform X3 n=1 Tax=Strix aluco TaxID=111821 RepID=UPI003DA47303
MLPSLAPHWASLGLPVAHWAGAGPFPERAECGWLGGPRTCPASAVSAMETGRVLGAGAVLVALVVLGAHVAGGEEPSGVFLEMYEEECQYLNGTEQVRLVGRWIYNREQFLHFDSDLGLYVADTPLGEPTAQYFNSHPELLQIVQADIERFCRYNYQGFTPYVTERKVEPKVRVAPVQSSSLPQTDRLACYVTGFYPAQIEVKWFQNKREETEHVVSTDVIPNGDWTYQVLVMLETTPQRGDTYTCQVEHVSLQHPISQRWELQSDGARSKMLTGVWGFVLGLIFLTLGLGLYVRKKGALFRGLQGS